MKKLFKLCTLVLLFFGSVYAQPDYEIQQGSTLEILFPVHLAHKISGTFEETPLLFSVVRKKPGEDEVITRGEFMHLLVSYLPAKNTNFISSEFPDVPKNHPYKNDIQKAANYQIINGYLNGNFGTEDTLTRAQAAKIIMKSFPSNKVAESIRAFPDVVNEHPLKWFIDQSVSIGIFKGYPDGNFRPNQPLSILEAKIIIERGFGKKIIFPELKKFYWKSLIGISRLKKPREAVLKLNLSGTSKTSIVEILPRKFETKSFDIPVAQNTLLEKPAQNNTWGVINAARENSNPKQLWKDKFIKPTEGINTLGYGDNLYINDKPAGSHFGHDYANKEGTPIYAANHGVVVLAEFTQSYGNTLMIDHGQNVFTMYLHNSELKVKTGEAVKKGQLISLMGSTGIATGSHLHYSHWVGDTIVDGAEWFEKEY